MKAKRRPSGRARGGICKLKKQRTVKIGSGMVDTALADSEEGGDVGDSMESGADFVVVKIDINIQSRHFSKRNSMTRRALLTDVSLGFRFWLPASAWEPRYSICLCWQEPGEPRRLLPLRLCRTERAIHRSWQLLPAIERDFAGGDLGSAH